MPHRFQFEIDESNSKERLDRFLYDQIGTVSRMYLADLIEKNLALVNNEPQPGGYKLKIDDKVSITVDETAETAMTPEDIPLEILFEDAEILVVNKPAGMLVHPTKTVKTGTLANALAFHLNCDAETRRHWDTEKINESSSNVSASLRLRVSASQKFVRPGIIHRLDKQTSGLMVIAKTVRAHRILSSHFQRKLVKKLYFALVEGIVAEDAGTINAPIGRLEEKPHWRVLPDGKEAETRFRVVERYADKTLLELEPVTGRTNQLRIHCAHTGHPIVGDEWYGGREFSRLCLHAAKLAFFHPNGGWLEFETNQPEEMKISNAL